MTEMSPEVKEFAGFMQKVLDNHKDRSDSWKFCTFEYLQKRMLEEVEETKEDDPKIGEWVDVANFCMMIYLTSIHNYNQEAAKQPFADRKSLGKSGKSLYEVRPPNKGGIKKGVR